MKEYITNYLSIFNSWHLVFPKVFSIMHKAPSWTHLLVINVQVSFEGIYLRKELLSCRVGMLEGSNFQDNNKLFSKLTVL